MSISLDPEKTLKLVRYDYLNRTVVPGQILFAGSSLMEQFPVHEFQLGAGLSSLIYNRGIGGFTTAEMLEHMETCVYALRPARIFLNIGTNDMNPDDYRKDELMERYEKMVKEILAHLPGVWHIIPAIMKLPAITAGFFTGPTNGSAKPTKR